jgi:hypothetical protein
MSASSAPAAKPRPPQTRIKGRPPAGAGWVSCWSTLEATYDTTLPDWIQPDTSSGFWMAQMAWQWLTSIRLLGKTLDHPSGCRSWRAVCAVNRMQGIDAVAPLRKIEPLQASCCKIIANHRLGHAAPTDTGQEQGMLGAQVGETPRLDADHPKITIFSEC